MKGVGWTARLMNTHTHWHTSVAGITPDVFLFNVEIGKEAVRYILQPNSNGSMLIALC